jgi:hypothetical protein
MADYTMPDNVQKRLRYFDGQFLRDQDFIDEQNYHLDRQQRHNRLLHAPGIVSGLEVTVKPETGEVTVAPGTALDSAGRQIVLSKETKLNLESTVAGQALLVYLAFAQETSDLAQTGSAEFTRWLEQPAIEIVREDIPPQGRNPVVLARLPIGQDGKVTQVDNNARGYAGVRLPGGPTLAANSSGQAQFNGALRVSGSPQDASGNTLILGPVESSNLRLGYHTNYSWIQSHGSKPLAINPLGNNVGIGTDNPQGALHIAALGDALVIKPKTMTGNDVAKIVFADPDNGTGPMSIEYKDSGSPGLAIMGGRLGVGTRDPAMRLSVSATNNHTQLRREKTETTGGKQLFLELYQDDPSNAVPEVNPSIRFHHNNKFWHRLEGRTDGLHFKEGNLNADGYTGVFTGNLTVKGNSALNGTVAVSATNNHAQLRREKTETAGGKQLFLELYQEDDTTPKVSEVNPSIRFQHANRYSHRIEGRSDGFHLKDGNLSSDVYRALFTGNLTVNGNSALNGTLAVSASGSHAQLRREKTETTGGKLLFLELYQDDDSTTVKVPVVYPSLRFHHSGRYWHRLEARNNGLHFKTGDLNLDDYINLFAGDINAGDINASDINAVDIKLSGKIDAEGHLSGSDVYFSENGQISSKDNNHRILFRRTEDKLELREWGAIIFSPGATSGAETAKVVFASNGRVGIGTTTPRVPLDIVGGSVAQSTDYYHYLSRSGTGDASNQSGAYSIRVSDRVLASEFNANSDERIKNIQGRSDGATDLDTLLGLQITDFRYKDVIGKGSAPHKRVIGQQVEEVFPQAVSHHTDVVPDIYQPAAMKEGWVVLATDLKKGERVKLIPEQGAAGVYEVLEVTPDKFRTDFQSGGDKVFVFGREVNDFRVVDYDALAMLNVSATQQIKQELDAELKVRQAENAELKARLEALEQEVLTRV